MMGHLVATVRKRPLGRVVVGAWAVAAGLSAFSCRQLLGYDELSSREPEHNEGDAGDDGGTSGCTSRRDCALNQLCVDPGKNGSCVNVPRRCALYPQQLGTRIDPTETVDPVFVAAYVPDFDTGPFLSMARALAQINTTGLPSGRQLGVLMCTALDEPEATFDELVVNLKVPAIVSGLDNNLLFRALDKHPQQTFVLNVSAANPDLANYAYPNYLLNMLGPVTLLAPSYPLLVQEADLALRARDAGATPRVALVYDDTAINYHLGTRVRELLGSRVAASICVNQSNAGINVECKSDAAAARKLLETSDANVVIALVSDVNFNVLVDGANDTLGYDRQKRAECGEEGSCLPLWITGPTNALYATDYVRAAETEARLAEAGPLTSTARRRFVGVQYAGPIDGTERRRWLDSMKEGYPDKEEALYASAENYYDALFYLAYGAVAGGLGKGEPAVDLFAAGVRSLVPLAPVSSPQRVLQPSDLRGSIAKIEAERAASQGRQPSFELSGASGPSSEIDYATSTWRSVGGVYCIMQGSDAGGFVTYSPGYDVLRHSELPADGDAGSANGSFALGANDQFCKAGTGGFEAFCGFSTLKSYCNKK